MVGGSRGEGNGKVARDLGPASSGAKEEGTKQSEKRLGPDSPDEQTAYQVMGHPEVSRACSLTTGGKLEIVTVDIFL